MAVYLDLVMVLNFLVDFLLFLGTNRLSGFPAEGWRCAGASLLGAVYSGACLLPGFRFLGNLLWHCVSLGLMGILAFGWEAGALKRSGIFLLRIFIRQHNKLYLCFTEGDDISVAELCFACGGDFVDLCSGVAALILNKKGLFIAGDQGVFSRNFFIRKDKSRSFGASNQEGGFLIPFKNLFSVER
jgi:hypothetical protein